MHIVIVGAGDVGRYIASILSKEQHNIILIDKNPKILEEASINLDVATRLGSGTDWQLLDDLLEYSPSLFIALTEDDETNIVSCSIAKHLGYPRTVARVRDNRYLNRARLDFARIFNVDYFIGPELLVAYDILKYMISPGSLAIEHFAHGAVQMRTFTIPQKWRQPHVPLSRLNLPEGMVVGLIYREGKVIFPHGEDFILPDDEVTFIGETDVVTDAHRLFGILQKKITSVTIVGGSRTSINLAKLLQHHGIDLRIIEKDYSTCCTLANLFPASIVLNHDATDLDFLLSEKIGYSDVFVACTRHDEINILSGMLAKQAECQNVVLMLANTSYTSIVAQLGLNYAVSPRISAANHILSQILSGKVTSLVSLYDNQAEIMEVNVSIDSKIAGIPLSELGRLLPKDFLICMIQNRGRIMIAHGNRVISPGDTVIVITNPKHVSEIERIF
jgi:trk system potassium uptake protein